jgi:hypothetical protein
VRFHAIFAGFCLVPLFCGVAEACLSSYTPAAILTGEADAIVEGSVESTLDNEKVHASIRVERVFKGAVSQGEVLGLAFALTPTGFPTSPNLRRHIEKGHGLFFLKRAAGAFSILPPVNGCIRWEEAYFAIPASVPQHVREEILASLPSNAAILQQVLGEVVVAFESGVILPIDVLGEYDLSHSPVLAAAFPRLQKNPNSTIAGLGTRGMIEAGDPSLIRNFYVNYATLSETVQGYSMLEPLRRCYPLFHPETIGLLGRIAADHKTRLDLRIAAATALADMHEQRVLPHLVKLLSDEDLTLQFMAVLGLSGFVNNTVRSIFLNPSFPNKNFEPGEWKYRTEATMAHAVFHEGEFRSQRAYYLDFWPNWWKLNRGTIVQ